MCSEFFYFWKFKMDKATLSFIFLKLHSGLTPGLPVLRGKNCPNGPARSPQGWVVGSSELAPWEGQWWGKANSESSWGLGPFSPQQPSWVKEKEHKWFFHAHLWMWDSGGLCYLSQEWPGSSVLYAAYKFLLLKGVFFVCLFVFLSHIHGQSCSFSE